MDQLQKDISLNEILMTSKLNCLDDDFIITDRLSREHLLEECHNRKYGVLFIHSMHGVAEIQIDSAPYTLNSQDSIIIFPDQKIHLLSASNDYNGFIFQITISYLKQLHIDIKQILPLILCVKNNPVCRFNEEDGIILNDYLILLKKKIKLKDDPAQLKIIQNIMETLFLELAYMYTTQKSKKVISSSRKRDVFNQFINLLLTHYKEERTVSFYADKLFISSKYLSATIKEISNKTPAEWINECVIFEIKSLLKGTSLNIQQVSEMLNFPNQSFLGKYFKRYTGMTPLQYKQS